MRPYVAILGILQCFIRTIITVWFLFKTVDCYYKIVQPKINSQTKLGSREYCGYFVSSLYVYFLLELK